MMMPVPRADHSAHDFRRCRGVQGSGYKAASAGGQGTALLGDKGSDCMDRVEAGAQTLG